jgi:hypothetical protein
MFGGIIITTTIIIRIITTITITTSRSASRGVRSGALLAVWRC